MASYYLVDTENTGLGEELLLALSGRLAAGDAVTCFSAFDGRMHIPCGLLLMVQDSGATFSLQKTYPGKNALDFQLSSWLGCLIAKNGKERAMAGMDTYYVVSNDTGYDPLSKFWAGRGLRVERLGTKAWNTAAPVFAESKPEPNVCRQNSSEFGELDESDTKKGEQKAKKEKPAASTGRKKTKKLPELSKAEKKKLRKLIPKGVNEAAVMQAYEKSKDSANLNSELGKVIKDGAATKAIFSYLRPVWKRHGYTAN